MMSGPLLVSLLLPGVAAENEGGCHCLPASCVCSAAGLGLLACDGVERLAVSRESLISPLKFRLLP
jgi:hypothetical protein